MKFLLLFRSQNSLHVSVFSNFYNYFCKKSGLTSIMLEVSKKRFCYFLIFAILFAFLAISCSTVEGKKSQLRIGMTKEHVISLLGKPIEGEKYCREDVFFYYDGVKWFDGSITTDECFPLVFEGDKLIGWGLEFYRLYIKKDW